ncbi:hypothetical protein FNV43_RR26621 [Rhamnella rubrinervis]|uniref:UspA domain-containing protein n=1 Tax=Rhamnella rubrinervis TaxID=2594499 RepID=A0A8K0DJ45_9ROSA|nr:hypothetical protein FNV43_RR26621 [Rhamnella rubrinervis]
MVQMEKEKEGCERKKVMVAIDERKSSYHALIWVLENLQELISTSSSNPNPNPLVLFATQPFTNHVVSDGSAASELIASIQENNKRFALALLEKAKHICAKHGVETETITRAGDPRETICEAVDELNIQLLVLGRHSPGVIERIFHGSFSDYCVHHAKCPVLVVRK